MRGMNFGVRLPGPFRVGVSSSGRMNVGVTAGPFSVSTGIGSRSRPRKEEAFYPIELQGAFAELVKMGWEPTYHDGRTVFLRKGWRAVRVDAVEGGVTWAPITNPRKAVAVAVAVLAILALAAVVF